MTDKCTLFARSARYRKNVLWTNSVLDTARTFIRKLAISGSNRKSIPVLEQISSEKPGNSRWEKSYCRASIKQSSRDRMRWVISSTGLFSAAARRSPSASELL
jgi:hypothetical protein